MFSRRFRQLLHSQCHAVKDEICCEFVAKWGLLSIYESGA